MKARQRLPKQWLITDPRIGPEVVRLVRRLPCGSGVILRPHLSEAEGRRIRQVAAQRGLYTVLEERGRAVRVHNAREIALARLGGARLLLLSPMFATATHPGAPALPRMRAAALARLAGQPLLALGGMDAPRFAHVRALGFDGWAGIDAWAGRAPSRK